MSFLILLVFIAGYVLIALESFIKVNKTAISLLTGVICWTIYILSQPDHVFISHQVTNHLGEISGILFFLMSAMTIVELIDAHDGFEIITIRIRTTNKLKLLWVIALLTFFLSAVLDNLTTTIVLVTLLGKLIPERKDRLLFASVVVIAANSGGAWSPIGDVTTTMLWIGNQITSSNIILRLFVPSLISLLVPLILISFTMKGKIVSKPQEDQPETMTSISEKKIILYSGLSVLLFVPVFKTITHLPPFMGILFGLGLLWLITELIHKKKDEEARKTYSVMNALEKMDMPSVLFFLGILLAIAALQTAGQLSELASWLNKSMDNTNQIGISLGLLSAVIDNVPMVAGAIGMYPLTQFPTDHSFWEILAYCTGTGGSILIIGSAAGIAAMGLERIEFLWYLKKISWLALIGYFAGAAVYIAEETFLKFY
jgi:Na+/H+ antiporter NhaD/arsenite permease-like protein